jgi:hypothetical protein
MWALVLAAAIGVWLMAAPAVLGFGGVAADVHRIVGPIATSLAIVAVAQVTRPVRWCNRVVGAALLGAAVVVDAPWIVAANLVVSGGALAALASVRGRIPDRFGGGWTAVWRAGRAA